MQKEINYRFEPVPNDVKNCLSPKKRILKPLALGLLLSGAFAYSMGDGPTSDFLSERTNVEFPNGLANISQERTITGTILDEMGLPLLGATVQIKGTTIGVTTDFDGNFSIKVPSEGAILVVSYIGYTTLEMEVGN